MRVAVSIVDGTSVTVAGTDVDPTRGLAQFSLTGHAIGMSRILVMGSDDNGISTPISVASVAATTLFVARPVDNGVILPDLLSTVHAFTGSTFPISRRSVGPGQSAVRGKAPLVLDAGATGVTYDRSCAWRHDGQHTRRCHRRRPTDDARTRHRRRNRDRRFHPRRRPRGTTIEVIIAGTGSVTLLPTDSAGHAIVGPIVTIGMPSLVGLTATDGTWMVRSIGLWPNIRGTTTLDVQWGAIDKTFTLKVASLDELPPA